MGTRDDIISYTNKMNAKFALNHSIKLKKLVDTICRHVRSHWRQPMDLTFTSQDLRGLTVAVEKVHKALNKTTSYINWEKRYHRYELVDGDVVTAESKKNAMYCGVIYTLQECLCKLNHVCLMTRLLEMELEQRKEKDDKYFAEEVWLAVMEGLSE